MSEIRDLRKSGDLETAYELGRVQIEQNPDDIWLKREFVWVCYDLAKLAVENSSKEDFLNQLGNIAQLGFDGNAETIIADSVMRLVIKWLYNNVSKIEYEQERIAAIREIVKAVSKLPVRKQSEIYSSYIKWMHRNLKGNLLYVAIMRCVDLDALMPEDHLPTEYDGQKIMSLAEQVYVAYAKGLINAINYLMSRGNSNSYEAYLTEARSYLGRLEKLAKSHPEYQYTLYYIVKLMLVLGENDDVIERLIPFVRKKSKDFWVWQTMAKALEATNREAALACCCMGLLCRAEEDKMVSLREYAAILFAENGYYREAKTEIEMVAAIRRRYWGKSINNNALLAIMHSDAYQAVQSGKDNNSFYLQHIAPAEELIYRADAEPVLITYVNQEKRIANFMTLNDEIGFFRYNTVLKETPSRGEVYDVVWCARENSFFKAAWCKKVVDATATPFYKQLEGVIAIPDNRSFGFVNEGVFVEPKIVAKYNLRHGDALRCLVVKTYDKKKAKPGWAVCDVLKL